MSCWTLVFVLVVYFCAVARCQTQLGDIAALSSLSDSLFPVTSSATAAENWDSNIDPCGASSCGISACLTIGSTSDLEASACSWTGICCNNWRVSGIVLDPTEASEPAPWLPGSLQNLTALTVLSLPQRGLSGTLPPGVGNLSNLTTVNLAGNDLSGFLPSSWGEMINLNSLDLSHNNLRGLVPATWFMPSQSAVAYKSGLRLAANAGLCSAPSGINMYFSLPQCDATTLQAQQAADPAAVAGASPSSPPSSPAAGVPVQLWPTQSTTSSSGEPMRLVWPFIILGLSGLVLGVFFGLHRKRRGLQQARSSHNRSRRATADGSADLPPSGPPPVLVTGPDGTLLALGVRETAAKTPAEIQGSESPVHDKDATAESGTQAGNHIQVTVHADNPSLGQLDSSAATTGNHPLPFQDQQQDRLARRSRQSDVYPWTLMYTAHVVC